MLLLQRLFTKAGCAGFCMAWEHRISFATDLAANFSYDRVRIMPDIVSKLFLATIGSGCAVKLESEQTPFSRASGRVRSAPLHRIRFGTCFFCLPQTVFYLGKPIESSFQLFLANSFKLFSANRFNLFSAVPYFYSEINGWSKDWVKRWARLWTSQPLVGNNFSPIPLKILFHIKKESDSLRPVGPKLTKHLNLFDSQLSQYCKSCSTFSSEASRSLPSATATISGTPCLCTRPELCRSAVPRDRSFKTFNCLWNSLLEWLPNDRQPQGLELRLNLNSAAWRPWPMGCKGAICSDTKRMAKPFQAKFLTQLL